MKTFLQLNTIFISMVMEAIPFILLGVIVSGVLHAFLSERWIARFIPKNRFLASLLGCGIGMLYPACDCGIVPVTGRLLRKGVPLHTGIAFLLTAPIINPVVLFATYVAFGNDWRMMAIRAGMAVLVAVAVSTAFPVLFPGIPWREAKQALMETAAGEELPVQVSSGRASISQKLIDVMLHAVQEFFSVGKYLVLGAFIAAGMQTFIPTASLLQMGKNPVTASLVMMGLAFVMSLCSEADAFIASSFRSTFTVGSLSAFLVFGPMIDIKNTLMLLGLFRGKFVTLFILLVAVCTMAASLLVGRLFG